MHLKLCSNVAFLFGHKNQVMLHCTEIKGWYLFNVLREFQSLFVQERFNLEDHTIELFKYEFSILP